MNEFINAVELSKAAGINELKAQRVIREANKRIKQKGGVIVKGKAPRRVLENILFIDLSETKEN